MQPRGTPLSSPHACVGPSFVALMKTARMRCPLFRTDVMAHWAGWALSAVALGTLAPLAHAQSGPARVIVKYHADAPAAVNLSAPTGDITLAAKVEEGGAQRLQSLSLRSGMPLRAGRLLAAHSQVVMAEGMTSQQLADQLARQPGVAYAVPDGEVRLAAVPTDPLYATVPVLGGSGGPVSGQWYLRAPTSLVSSSINAEPAWDLTLGNPSVVVAVIDSGVRFDHPDMPRVSAGGNLLDGYDLVSEDFRSNDGTPGRDADASDPGDWISSSDLASLTSCLGARVANSSWHGTQVAGLIGALTNNGIGIASVGRTVRILPVRVIGKCATFDSDLIAGARWAAGLEVPGVPRNPTPARVLNISLGGNSACSASYRDGFNEIIAAGTVVVAAGGNSVGHALGSPANCPGVISVAGLRHVGTKASFSDLGREITLSAPGGNCINGPGQPCLYPIMTTTNPGTTTPVIGPAGGTYTDSYNVTTGTSFSAPLVAGAAALMLSVNPRLNPADVTSQLQRSARPFPTSGAGNGVPACEKPNAIGEGQFDQLECYCTTTTCGAGMLDVGAAVQLATSSFLPRISVSPTTPQATVALTLSTGETVLPAGRTVTGYQWTVLDSGGIVTTVSGANNATAIIVPAASGRFTVQLTLTDDQGATATTTRSIEVAAAAPGAVASGDGGGGAIQPWALLGLGAAVWLLRRGRRSPARPV